MPGYDLLAIDLDGTLIGRDGRVSPRNLDALRRARAAGIRTIICTGRSLAECRHVAAAIDQTDPAIVAGGAIIACPVTQKTLHRFAVDPAVVAHAVEVMLGMEHAALVLKDPLAAGYDYLVVRGPDNVPLDPVTKWWFASMDVRTREVASLAEDEHPEHSVRVGACGPASSMARAKARLHERFADDILIHHFGAVVAPDSAKKTDAGEVLHVLEAFDKSANKWSAIRHLAGQWGIPAARIAALGDEINDVSMIAGAGLGIAMGNAIPAVKAAAKAHTAPHDQDGVADAIDRILSNAL